MKEYVLIATTIQKQLYAGGRMIVWSWGAYDFMAMPPTKDSLGGLEFRVNGRLYQGKVYVKLAFDDTYTIELRRKEPNPEQVIKNVYCDQLTEVIDYHVETGP